MILSQHARALESLASTVGVDPQILGHNARGFLLGLVVLLGRGFDLKASHDRLTAWPGRVLTEAELEQLFEWGWCVEEVAGESTWVSFFPGG
jgi:hypothetical protein